MSYNTVIFDFDGTVINTNQVVINSWQHTYKTIYGHEHDVADIVKTFGEPLAVSIEKAFPGYDVDKVIDIYRGYQVNHFEEMIELFPGMENLFVALRDKGIKVAIVTSRTRVTTLHGLDKYDLVKYTDTIVSCDDTDKHKPDPEPAFMALRQLGVSPDEAVMVGDSMFDIRCAHNAKIKAVLVGWAIAVSQEELEGPDGPDAVISKAEELLELLED